MEWLFDQEEDIFCIVPIDVLSRKAYKHYNCLSNSISTE